MGIMRSPGIDMEQASPMNTARRVVGLLASRPYSCGRTMSVCYARRREEGVWAWPFLTAFGVGLLACQASTERTNRDASAGGAESPGTAADAKAGTGGAAAADAKAGTGGAAAGDAEVGRCAPAG